MITRRRVGPATKVRVAAPKKLVKKEFTLFTPVILSRHPSHNVLRRVLPKMSTRSIVRLGSTTVFNDGKRRIEINSVEAIKNSSSKLRMKRCFKRAGVATAEWIGGADASVQEIKSFCAGKFPIIAKGIFGSRGQANTKLDTPEQLNSFLSGKSLDNYIFEVFFDGAREYRFHISTEGVFLTWRKLRRNDTPDNQRWFFNNANCNWVGEANELYNRPNTYNEIGRECVKALNACGLDIGGCDVRVSKTGEFRIIEINSACSLAEQTGIAYRAELTKLLNLKNR